MRRAVLIGVVAVLAGAAGPIDTSATPEQRDEAAPLFTRQVYATTTGARTFRVDCPPGWLATGGTAVAAGQGTKITRSWSAGRSAWVFRTESRGTTYAVVTCIRSGRASAISSRSATKRVRLVGGPSLVSTVRCPPEHTPTGAGFDLASSPEPLAVLIPPPAEWVTFTTMSARPDGWRFGMFNHRSETRVDLFVRCLRLRTGALRTSRVTREVRLSPGERRDLALRCPRGRSPLFAGWAGPGREVRVTGTITRRKRPRYVLTSSADAPATVSLDLLCIRDGV